MRKVFSHSNEDEYMTPQYAVDIIKPYIKSGIVWCPFDKSDSKYVETFNGIYTHIDNGQDFLTYKPDFEFDYIISNPPFSIKNEVIKKCLEYNKPFVLLLPFTMFNSIASIRLLNTFNVQFLMMDRRISFNGERPNFTCWYVCKDILPKDNMIYIFEENPMELYKKEKEL